MINNILNVHLEVEVAALLFTAILEKAFLCEMVSCAPLDTIFIIFSSIVFGNMPVSHSLQ